ncbi:hypothetical protein ACFP1Z_19100 [Streptomyces gamaensis]|uniref:Uncharacterized protein n=1 Tax=Streptomyces gamaensis TaxID=1763542 RepID=A0ABW0Z0N9_9ACTN
MFSRKPSRQARPAVSAPVQHRHLLDEEAERKDTWHRQSLLQLSHPHLTALQLWALGKATFAHALDRSELEKDGNVVTQRNIGIELEEQRWRVTDASGAKVPTKTVIIKRPHFELQAESSGDTVSVLEMVTDSPGVTRAEEWLAMKREMCALIDELKASAGSKKRAVKSGKLVGGAPGYLIHPPQLPGKAAAWNPFLQVTAGIPLAAIPRLLRTLNDDRLATVVPPGVHAEEKLARHLAPVFSRDGQPSAELTGLAALLAAMLTEGASRGCSSIPFLKGAFAVMPRTALPHMFMLLPAADRELLAPNPDAWVEALARISGRSPDEPVVSPSLAAPGTTLPVARLTTSVDTWLRAMLPRVTDQGLSAGVDLLTVEGKLAGLSDDSARGRAAALSRDVSVQSPSDNAFSPVSVPQEPEQLQELLNQLHRLHDAGSLGGLGAVHDTVKYSGGHSLPAAVLEIRRPAEKSWAQYMDSYLDRVYQAVGDSLAAVGGSGR